MTIIKTITSLSSGRQKYFLVKTICLHNNCERNKKKTKML